jgi:hypothetical protein
MGQPSRTPAVPRDRYRIDVADPTELAYWSKQLRVPEERIKNAVLAVGSSIDAVKAYVGAR